MTTAQESWRLPKGTCPVCGLDIVLRGDGTTRAHPRGTPNRCPGSGLAPGSPAPSFDADRGWFEAETRRPSSPSVEDT